MLCPSKIMRGGEWTVLASLLDWGAPRAGSAGDLRDMLKEELSSA